MKKIFLTMIITVLVMLVIGNGLGLAYLAYKCDTTKDELADMKMALAKAGIEYDTETDLSVNNTDNNKVVDIEESATPEAEQVEKLEDNESYQEYINKGLEKIDVIAKNLPDYYAYMAIQELVDIDVEKLANKEWNDDKKLIEKECKDAWEDIVKDVAKDIFDIMNSDEDIDAKLDMIKEYGNLAYPIMENINDVLRDDEEIRYSKCKLSYDFSLKEKNEIKDYVDDCKLSSDEIEVLNDYIEYVAD